MSDLQPFPAWNAGLLLDSSDRQPESPVSALGEPFAFLIAGAVKLARTTQESERYAAGMLAA